MGSHRRLAPSGFDRGAGARALSSCQPRPRPSAPSAPGRRRTARRHPCRGGPPLRGGRAGHRGVQQGRRARRLAAQGGRRRTGPDRPAARSASTPCGTTLGSLAGAQYRAGGIDPSLALLFSDDPDDYLDKAAALDRISVHQAGELKALQTAMRELAQERSEATAQARRTGAEPQGRRPHKRTVEQKLARRGRLLDCAAVRGARRLRPGVPLRTRRPARPRKRRPRLVPRRGRPRRGPLRARQARTSGAPTGPPASTVRA